MPSACQKEAETQASATARRRTNRLRLSFAGQTYSGADGARADLASVGSGVVVAFRELELESSRTQAHHIGAP